LGTKTQRIRRCDIVHEWYAQISVIYNIQEMFITSSYFYFINMDFILLTEAKWRLRFWILGSQPCFWYGRNNLLCHFHNNGFSCGTGNLSQGLLIEKQVLNHWAMTPALLGFCILFKLYGAINFSYGWTHISDSSDCTS
jgi:hypothetical protein